jgi:hypothetical protein
LNIGGGAALPRVRTSVRDGLLLFVVVFVVFELSINGIWATDHGISFTQLDYALWHDHSVGLRSAATVPPWTVDDFIYKGENYSALAPGTPFLALPFLGVAFTIYGGYTSWGPSIPLSETFVALMGAGAACLVYLIALLFFRRSTSAFLALAFAFSTICWPFATYFFQSDVSAFFVLLTAYFALRASRAPGSGATASMVSGLAAGIAFSVDYVNVTLLPFIIVFLLVSKRSSKAWMARSACAFIIGALPGLAAIGAYNYAIFGNPFTTTEQYFNGKTSVFASFTTPIYSGLELDLFSFSRGLFAYSPILALGAMGYVDAFRSSNRRETLLLLGTFLCILLPYAAWYQPDGGVSFGPRFLVAAIPFLLLPAGYVLESIRKKALWCTYTALVAGVVINGLGALVSAIPPQTPSNVSPLTNTIIPRLIVGNLNVWWIGDVGSYWPLATTALIASATVIPIAWYEVLRRRERAQDVASTAAAAPEQELGARPSQTRIIKNGAAVFSNEPPVQKKALGGPYIPCASLVEA